MLGKLLLLFKIKDLRKKILFILMIFGIFRLAANLPIPFSEISSPSHIKNTAPPVMVTRVVKSSKPLSGSITFWRVKSVMNPKP